MTCACATHCSSWGVMICAFIAGRSCAVRDELGELWREDATNADTDHFARSCVTKSCLAPKSA